MPIVYASIANSVAIDCVDGVCAPGSSGGLFLEVFDDDGDGAITFDEVSEDALVRTPLQSDIDYLDAEGRPNPRCDGIKDGLSVAVGFTAVPASFDPPPL